MLVRAYESISTAPGPGDQERHTDNARIGHCYSGTSSPTPVSTVAQLSHRARITPPIPANNSVPQTPSPPSPTLIRPAALVPALVPEVELELGTLAVTVLCAVTVDGPVALEEDMVVVTLVATVTTLVAGPPGSELERADEADATEAEDEAEDADADAEESTEEAAELEAEAESVVVVVIAEGEVESEVMDNEGVESTIELEAAEAEGEIVGRSEEREEAIDMVVRGSVMEAVILLASEAMVEMMLSGPSVTKSVVDSDVVRRTSVAVRLSVSVA